MATTSIAYATDEPQSDIPELLRERLAGYDVLSLRQWAQLSPHRKRSLFGIPPTHRRWLDSLAAQVPAISGAKQLVRP